YGTSALPSGSEANNYTIICTVNAYDSLLAYSTASQIVQVMQLKVSTAELLNLVSSQLNSSSGNTDATKQVLATVGAILNTVNCSSVSVSYCQSLNRLPCSTTSQTCGRCIPDSVGEDGNANSKCILLSAVKAQPA